MGDNLIKLNVALVSAEEASEVSKQRREEYIEKRSNCVDPAEAVLLSYQEGVVKGYKRAADTVKFIINEGLLNRELEMTGLAHKDDPEGTEDEVFKVFVEETVELLTLHRDLMKRTIDIVFSQSKGLLDDTDILKLSGYRAYQVGRAQGFTQYLDEEIEGLDS